MHCFPARVSILIPTHNRSTLLIQTLQSFAAVKVPDQISLEVIVAANACTDGTVEACKNLARTFPFPFRCITEPEVGIGHARNRLILESHGDILAFLDDDLFVDTDWLNGLVESFKRFPADIVAGRVELSWKDVEQPPWMDASILDLLSFTHLGDKPRELFDPGKVLGGNFAFRRSVLDVVAKFRTDLGHKGRKFYYGEETDFIAQAMKAESRVFYSPQAKVLHRVSPERIRIDSLGKMAFGYAQARVILFPEQFSESRVKLLYKHIKKIFAYGFRETIYALMGSKRSRVHYHIRRMTSWGIVKTVFTVPNDIGKCIDSADLDTAVITSNGQILDAVIPQSSLTVSILIPTHNRAALLTQTLERLSSVSVPARVSVEVIVAANACTDDTVTVCKTVAQNFPFPLRCVSEPQIGVGHARNRLVSEAHGDILIFLDDDVYIVDPHWLSWFLRTFDRFPADIVAGKIALWWKAVAKPSWMDSNMSNMLGCTDLGPGPKEIFDPGKVLSGNFAFRRSVLETVGSFRTDLGRRGRNFHYGEETDFVAQAMKAECRVFYAPQTAVLHWMSSQCITPGSLGKMAFGYAQARVLMNPEQFAEKRFKLICEHAIKMHVYRFPEILCALFGLKRARVRYRIRSMTSRGLLSGLSDSPDRRADAENCVASEVLLEPLEQSAR